jgi:hypothetical protein
MTEGALEALLLRELDGLTAELDNVRLLPGATMGYDLIADAIVWSDEYPSSPARPMAEYQCLKAVLRYRTSLLTEIPDERCRRYWEHAKALFPNWAGFTPSRRVPSDELKRFYEHRAKWDRRHLEKVLSWCGRAGKRN